MINNEIKEIVKEAIKEYNQSVLVNLKSAETREFIRDLVKEIMIEFRNNVCPINVKKEDEWKAVFEVIEPRQLLECYNFTQEWREATQNIKKNTIRAVVVTIISGILGLIWLTIKN